jgi:hypothetical protein
MKFVKWLFGQNCSHQFAWPRNNSAGSHYQICLTCGTAYEYDWMNMRRTRKLIAGEIQHRHVAETTVSLVRALLAATRGSARDQISRAHS